MGQYEKRLRLGGKSGSHNGRIEGNEQTSLLAWSRAQKKGPSTAGEVLWTQQNEGSWFQVMSTMPSHKKLFPVWYTYFVMYGLIPYQFIFK